MIGPALVGVINVDLSGCVSKEGYMGAKAGYEAWKAIAGLPAGTSIRLNVGNLHGVWGSDLIDQLNGAEILKAGTIEVIGTDPAGVRDVLTRIAGLRDGV